MPSLRKVLIDDSGRGTMRTELDEAEDRLDNFTICAARTGLQLLFELAYSTDVYVWPLLRCAGIRTDRE